MPKPVRFAVIGAGHITQSVVLPAFHSLARSARLVAVLSDDATKRRALTRTYALERTWSEDALPEALASGAFDALYVATPNHRHLAQVRAALRAGIHVLTEKPMTATLAEAKALATAARRSSAKAMVAYRLHCDPFYSEVIRQARSGAIGELRLFHASFTMQVRPGDVRTRARFGGGSVPDLGIYCINAARAVFRAEPLEVRALAVGGRDARSREVDEATGAILRFPGDRLATFTSGFGSAATCWFEIVGTTGSVCLDQAFAETGEMEMTLTSGGRTRTRNGRVGDQFAAEIAYFADCIRRGRDPGPDIAEGLRDLRVIDAIQRATRGGGITLPRMTVASRRSAAAPRRKAPPKRKPRLVHAQSPATSD